MASAPTASRAAGPLLREWRARRRLSQLELSARTGVSTRHLSCVENGKARPSRELLVYLADELDLPHRATNELLLAAGFAPVHTELPLDDAAMGAAREVIDLVLSGHDPDPATVIDTRWNVVDANAAALWLTSGVAPELLAPPLNVVRISLHPDGLAPRIRNLTAYAGELLRHMRHVLEATADPGLAEVVEECEAYVPEARRHVPTGSDVVVPLELTVDGHDLSFLSTATRFGTSRDVTLSELSIELLYPADAVTRAVLATRPWS